jgi:RTA1 like protein
MYYIIIFSTFDVVALTVQAIGGAGAAQAQIQGTDTTPSTHIMVQPFVVSLFQEAGIVVQGVGNIVFSAAALLLYFRTRRNCRAKGVPTPFPKTRRFKIFVAAIIISDLAIIIRAIYRVIELAQGWSGYLITTEPWFYGFDTALMIICMAVWVVGHPGITLGPEMARSNLLSKEFAGNNPSSRQE